MKSLSFWAKTNPVLARLIIIASRISLFFIAFFLANANKHFVSAIWTLYGVAFIFLLTLVFYPKKKRHPSYWRRKSADLFVSIGSFMVIFLFALQLNSPFTGNAVRAAVPLNDSGYKYPEAQRLLLDFSQGNKTKLTAKEKKRIKKEFNYQVLRYTKAHIAGDEKQKSHAGLIILACIAAAGLLFLVASLACTLSCNGSDAAAVILVILGTAGIVFGLIAVIRAIKRKGTTPVEETQENH